MTDETQDALSLSVRRFISAVGAKTPTPGGGSVAGLVGALAVALGQMSLSFTRGKKKFAPHEEYYRHLAGRLDRARGMFQDLVADDIAAYGLYQDSTRQADGPDKEQAVQLALAAATQVPRESAKLALAVLGDLQELAPRCSPYLITDLAAAAVLAAAVARMCDYNVRVNVPQLADRQAAGDLKEASAADLRRAQELLDAIDRTCRQVLP